MIARFIDIKGFTIVFIFTSLTIKLFVVYSFVRFVSTPEILERAYTIESEILQIEEAIAIQGNNDISVSVICMYNTMLRVNFFVNPSVHCSPWQIKDQYVKPVASNEGR